MLLGTITIIGTTVGTAITMKVCNKDTANTIGITMGMAADGVSASTTITRSTTIAATTMIEVNIPIAITVLTGRDGAIATTII